MSRTPYGWPHPRPAKGNARWVVVTLLCFMALIGWFYFQELRSWARGYQVVLLSQGVKPADVNRRGEVALNLDIVAGHLAAGRWENQRRRIVPIDLPAGSGLFAEATSINASGVIAGNIREQESELRVGGFIWTRTEGFRTIEDPIGREIEISDVNEENQVLGTVYSEDDAGAWHPFVWSPENGFIDVGSTWGAERFDANAINDSGWVVGSVSRDDAPGRQAFLWRSSSGLTMLDFELARTSTEKATWESWAAIDINNGGRVLLAQTTNRTIRNSPNLTVDSFQFTVESYRCFFWEDSHGLLEIPEPPGQVEGFVPISMNEHGDAFVQTWSPTGAAFGPSTRLVWFVYSNSSWTKLPETVSGRSVEYVDFSDNRWFLGEVTHDDGPKTVRQGVLLQLLR